MSVTQEQVNALYQELLGRDGDAPGLNAYLNKGWSLDRIRLDMVNSPEYAQRQAQLSSATPPPSSATPPPAQNTTPQVVPGPADPNAPGQINIADWGGQVAMDPSKAFNINANQPANTSMLLQQHVQGMDPNTVGTNINPNAAKYQTNPSQFSQQAAQGQAATAAMVDPRQAVGYNPQLAYDQVAQHGQMTAAQGQLSQGSTISAVPQIDIESTALGQNELGRALQYYAEQDLNDVDPKATLQGQMAILQEQFVDKNGNPTIPFWAAGTARNVQKIAAFTGMTGTAATAAMSQALLEASVSVAAQDAQFFQTLTLQNLNNKQAMAINRANVLSKMELANQDSRTAAAILNAQHFMQMDLANLNNQQQAEIVNTQLRVQAILEDQNAVNTARLFQAQSQNEMNRFYDQLNAQIGMYNAGQQNQMTQFNVGQTNAMRQFNAGLESQREQFYQSMQYNIDLANAKWRQTVTMTQNAQAFEAAALDVRNMVGMSVEQINRLWDRSDSLLDYVWKSTESEMDRQHRLTEIKLAGSIKSAQESAKGWGSIFGTIAGSIAQPLFSNFFGGTGLFGG